MLYDYRCKQCNRETEAVNSIAERRSNAPVCCEQQMEIFIKAAPVSFVDREIHYRCPVTNEGVTSRRQRNEVMKRNNLIDANDFVNRKVIQRRKEQHEAQKAMIDRGPEQLRRQVEEWATR